MITIDGSFGEGGGQIVRSSLALSMVTGKPVTINNVRARRDKPGLKRQHLTAVQAAARVCDAVVQGDSLGSTELVFEPGPVKPGEYQFRIGTAGSTTLVLQTILPALWMAGAPSSVRLEGGTHNPFAPPFDFLRNAYLPLAARMGLAAHLQLQRPGFYPAGGGKIEVRIEPSRHLPDFELLERGKLMDRKVRALVAHLPKHIGERECDTFVRRSGWEKRCAQVEEIEDSSGPGNVILIELRYQHVTEVFIGHGEKRVTAEKVAARAWKLTKQYLDFDTPVGEYLADQLILPLALNVFRGGPGGRFRTSPLSLHATTHIEVVRQFMDLDIEVTPGNSDDYVVCVQK